MGPSPLNTRIEIEGARDLVVYAEGEVDAVTLRSLRDALTRALEQSDSVVLDMGGVTFMDSSGLGVLVGSHRAAQQAGGSFRIRRPSLMVRKVLSITGLESIIQIDDVFDREREAE